MMTLPTLHESVTGPTPAIRALQDLTPTTQKAFQPAKNALKASFLVLVLASAVLAPLILFA